MVAAKGLVDVLVQRAAGALALLGRAGGVDGSGAGCLMSRAVDGAGGVGALRTAKAVCGAGGGRVGARGA